MSPRAICSEGYYVSLTFNFQLGHPHFLTVTILRRCYLRTLDVHYQPLLFYEFTALAATLLSIVLTLLSSVLSAILYNFNE